MTNRKKTEGDLPESEAEEASDNTWKSRKMVRGRWREKGGVPAKKIKHRMISVRIRDEELALFDEACLQLGVKRNAAFRAMARKASGILDIDKEMKADLRDAVRQLRGVANNINQIARLGNTTGKPDYDAFLKEALTLAQQIRRTDDVMSALLSKSQLKEEGLQALSRLLEQQGSNDA